jgi:hypothetical protein
MNTTTPSVDPSEWMGADQAIKSFPVSKATLYRWKNRNLIKTAVVRIENTVKIRRVYSVACIRAILSTISNTI